MLYGFEIELLFCGINHNYAFQIGKIVGAPKIPKYTEKYTR